MAFGLVLVLGIMIGAIIVLAMMPDYINVWDSDMWAIMTLPSLGFVLMLVIMFFFYRKMTGQGGLIAGMRRLPLLVHRIDSPMQNTFMPTVSYSDDDFIIPAYRQAIDFISMPSNRILNLRFDDWQ